ncbi:Quinolinate synthase protein [Thalictrum thalictroides]|uniref:Quinolinate synthase protein n=1 Tax=Thalictrum thalictroides TaxID=46969 RepID=A0A7J6W1Z4_THATH|nr:Quinolinate synthase protein [Thalictrum thalictroides]
MALFFSSPSSCSSLLPISTNTPPRIIPRNNNKLFFKPLTCSISNSTKSNPIYSSSYKLQHIVTEFKSLSEPIDRVKRLLHYATLLPRFNELGRVSSNKVTGCTVQVWLDVRMDEFGRMRFLADSDSEIMKGFCSCLIWLLDGEFPEDVLKFNMEDLEVLNIGSYGRANSRVNTWNSVLISMKKRTQLLVENDLPSLCLLH